MKNLFLIVAFLGLTSLCLAQTEKDVQTVIQMSIDIDELQPYFHPEKDGRKPLLIEDNELISNDLKLVKFDEPVQFMEMKDLFFNNITAFLKFYTFEMSPTSASVVFTYHIEGVKVRLTFEKINGDWSIVKKSLIEE